MANEKTISRELRSGVYQMLINHKYYNAALAATLQSLCTLNFNIHNISCDYSALPAPHPPRLNTPFQVLIPAIFDKLSFICQTGVRPVSALMSFYKFVIYCLYSVIYSRQPCQPIFQHYTHVRVRACARGKFVFEYYLEFVRNRSDRSDISILAMVAACHMADGWLTWADINVAGPSQKSIVIRVAKPQYFASSVIFPDRKNGNTLKYCNYSININGDFYD